MKASMEESELKLDSKGYNKGSCLHLRLDAGKTAANRFQLCQYILQALIDFFHGSGAVSNLQHCGM